MTRGVRPLDGRVLARCLMSGVDGGWCLGWVGLGWRGVIEWGGRERTGGTGRDEMGRDEMRRDETRRDGRAEPQQDTHNPSPIDRISSVSEIRDSISAFRYSSLRPSVHPCTLCASNHSIPSGPPSISTTAAVAPGSATACRTASSSPPPHPTSTRRCPRSCGPNACSRAGR